MKWRHAITITACLLYFANIVFAQTYRIAAVPKGEKNYGYINLKGETILPPLSLIGFSYTKDGTIVIVTNKRLSHSKLYDKMGNEIIAEIDIKLQPDEWTTKVFGYSGGIVRLRENRKWGGMNTKGKIAVQFIYDELTDFNDGFALGKRDNKYYVVDKNGNEILIERNDEITYIKHFTEGMAPIETNGKRFGFVNTEGKIIIEPEYITVGYYSAGYAWVRVKNKTIGFIDKKGRWIIEPKFAVVQSFDKESGLAMVKKSKNDVHWTYTDTLGVIKNFSVADKHYSFKDGLAMAGLNDKYGYIDKNGNWAIMPVFDNEQEFYNGYAGAKMGKLWGIINTDGDWIIEPKYKRIDKVVLIE